MNEDLSTFECQKDSDVEFFLKTKAVDFERRHLARTYLIIDEDRSVDELAILAYFTIAINYMKVNQEVPRAIRDQLNVRTKRPTIPCYLIGQLARNDHYSHRDITGTEILNYAMGYLVEAQRHVAGCCVRIDCKDNQKVMEFYSNNGFKFIQKNEDGDLCQLVKLIPSSS